MIAASVICALAPRIVWKYRIRSWHIETGELEQEFLSSLCCHQKVSVDIGAAAGTYSVRLLLHSSRVIAFEPNPEAALRLRGLFRHTRIMTVEEVALSDRSGVATLLFPSDRPMLGTIDGDASAALERTALSVPVALKRLDDYGLRNVGFIKIDVEGHEIAVLDGAAQTIERERPNLLIEINHTHLPQVHSFFERLRYRGFFVLKGALVDIGQFDPSVHQNPSNLTEGRRTGCYINNFIFVPSTYKIG